MDIKIGPATEAASVDFTISGSFTLHAEGLTGFEAVKLWRKGPDGAWHPARNSAGDIELRRQPNIVVMNATGSVDWRLTKEATAEPVSVGVTV